MAREEAMYNYMENVLQKLNSAVITVQQEEKTRNNVILANVLTLIISKMRNIDKLFHKIFSEAFYGGSYYDGLKVGKPDEYDLDLLLKLPVYAEPVLSNSNIPGYVDVRFLNMQRFLRQPYAKDYPKLAENCLDADNYLSINKVLRWMESLIDIAFNNIASYNNVVKIRTPYGPFYVKKVRKQSPAFTLHLEGTVDENVVYMDIDLVPCFFFEGDNWPEPPFRQNPTSNADRFFIVPKPPNRDDSRNWRLSFQIQERILINGLYTLKPVLRLLKRLRDAYDHKCIASYYIKTIFLWEVEDNVDTFWNKSLSYVFMTMLKKYQQFIERGEIPYYWNDENNLIQKPKRVTLFNNANALKRIIADIENHPEDPERVLAHLVRQMVPESATSEDDRWDEIIQKVYDSEQNDNSRISNASSCTVL